uniref:IgGFc_binding domain-containing protein n=1 Tax=Rhabditophanes sp. KR3021 TaxID=114890 RepID=A0AC35U4N3_9BILA
MKGKFVLCAIASVLLFANICAISDSEGSYFVASFAQYIPEDDPRQFKLELVFIPSTEDITTISTSWYSQLNNSIVKNTLIAQKGTKNIQEFHYDDIVDDNYMVSGSVNQFKDPRIIITSDKPMKVIARIFDTVTGRGDAYDLISENIISNEYEVNLPKSNDNGYQIIQLFGKDTATVTVEYIHFMNNTQFQKGTIILTKEVGSNQNIFTIPFDNNQHSFYFKGDIAFYITAAVTNVDFMYYTRGNSDGLGNAIFEYVAHQPVPLSPYDCKHLFNEPTDIRMTTIQNAVSVYMGAGALNCGDTFPLYTLNDNRNQRSNGFGPDDSFAVPGTLGLVTDFNTTVGTTAFGIQVTHVQAPWARLGTMRDANQTAFGLFIHYTPESTQFVTGDTTFYTFSEGDMIEIYGDKDVGPAEFTLDGLNVLNAAPPAPIAELPVGVAYLQSTIPIKLFKNLDFNAFTIVITTGGLHTFSSKGKYVVYVMGKNDVTKPFIYGYTASYDTSKLTSYWAAEPTTTVPIVTTVAPIVTTAAPIVTTTVPIAPITTTTLTKKSTNAPITKTPIDVSTITIMTTTSGSTLSSSFIFTMIAAFCALIIHN